MTLNHDRAHVSHCLVALGANRGDTEQAVRTALERLNSRSGTQVVRFSSFFRTAPVGGPPGQSDFINAAALLSTDLSAEKTLRWLLDLECKMGRNRIERWGPREIDLDLLLFEQESVIAEGLIVPHPRMSFRRFVLEPAAEAAPEMVHPEIGWSMNRLLDHLNHSPFFLAITGTTATRWAKHVAATCHGTGVYESEVASTGSPADSIRQSVAGGQLVVTDFLPQDLPADLSPRLTAVIAGDTGSIQVEGPTLKLAADADTIAADLEAAVAAMQ